jgi:ABC-type phosphate transport system permease subunit
MQLLSETFLVDFLLYLPAIVIAVFGYIHFSRKENVQQRSMKYVFLLVVLVVVGITAWVRSN